VHHTNGFLSTSLRQPQHSLLGGEFTERVKNIAPRSCDEAELARHLKHSLALQDRRTACCWSLLYTIWSLPRMSPLSGSKVFLRNMQVRVRISRPWMKPRTWVRGKRQDRKSEGFQGISLRGSRRKWGEGELYELVKKNTASLPDNMKKIVETNNQGYQTKCGRRLTQFIHFPPSCPQLHVSSEERDSAMPHNAGNVRVT
jgi:hypothetical protein